MPYTKAQYDTLLGTDSNETDALNRVTGRFEYITATYPALAPPEVALMVNSISLERANQTNEAFTTVVDALTASRVAITAAISALSGWGE